MIDLVVLVAFGLCIPLLGSGSAWTVAVTPPQTARRLICRNRDTASNFRVNSRVWRQRTFSWLL